MRDTSLYTVDGQRVVSVTEALIIAGVVDFSSIPWDRLELARERGTRVHHVCAQIAHGTPSEDDVDLRPYIVAFCGFLKTSGFKPRLIEHSVINTTYRYAGTLDLDGEFPSGEDALIDIKTGRAPSWAGMQLALYDLALHSPKTHRRYNLELRFDGTYRLQPCRSYADYANGLAAVRIAQWLIKEKRIAL